MTPKVSDIRDAARRLAGWAVTTPLLESPLLNEKLGGRLLIKAEMFQRTGSFKFRGAFNRLSRIDEADRAGGVVAYSSGNHAQGVAAAAQLLGMAATIFMPDDAPRTKLDNTRSYGAEVIVFDRRSEDRAALAENFAAEKGATLVRPYDDPYVIAGQGTVGLELAAQAADQDARIDAVLVPCGGGGLVSGSALALSEESPDTAVYAVEPEGFDDTVRSLAAGERLSVDADARSFCDALLVQTPGEMTFPLNSRLLAGGFAVDDDSVKAAMAAAFRYFKAVVEPGGAVALAACLNGAFDCRGKTVVAVCSGGNVDAEKFVSALKEAKD